MTVELTVSAQSGNKGMSVQAAELLTARSVATCSVQEMVPVARHNTSRDVIGKRQLKICCAGMKAQVMVIDTVGSNWLPRRSRAQQCFILTCKGLKGKDRNTKSEVSAKQHSC